MPRNAHRLASTQIARFVDLRVRPLCVSGARGSVTAAHRYIQFHLAQNEALGQSGLNFNARAIPAPETQCLEAALIDWGEGVGPHVLGRCSVTRNSRIMWAWKQQDSDCCYATMNDVGIASLARTDTPRHMGFVTLLSHTHPGV